MSRGLGWVAVGFLFLGFPFVSAMELFPLTGTLRGETPYELEGLLLIHPNEASSLAFVNFDSTLPQNEKFGINAERSKLALYRWENSQILNGNSPQTGISKTTMHPRDFSGTIQIDQLQTLPQMALSMTPLPFHESSLKLEPSTCQIQPAPSHEPLEFPQDPRRVSHVTLDSPQSKTTLVANCQTQALFGENPHTILFYGMDLLLVSDDKTELVRTGTFEESDSTGLFQKQVTQVLRLTYNQALIKLQSPLPSNVQIHARSFELGGTLQAGSSQGNLRWGALQQNGPVEAFEANGIFQMESFPEDHVFLDGQTFDGPVHPHSQEISFETSSNPIAIAVSLGLGALLLRLVWTLFTKIPQDKILEHPQRSRIFEFVRNQPGVEAHTLGRSLGLARGMLLHHLETLRRGGQLVIRHVGGRTALFVANAGFRGKEEVVSLLRRPSNRRIHDLLKLHPQLDQEAIAEAIGVTRSRVSFLLLSMERAGLVQKQRKGLRLVYVACHPFDPTEIRSGLSPSSFL